MARYINEDEFIAWVREHWCLDCQNDCGLRCRACWIDDAIDIVEEAPTADVTPKSEVDKLKATIERLEQEKAEMLVSATTDIPITMETLFNVRTEHPIFKAIESEVAREIFEEIASKQITIVDHVGTMGVVVLLKDIFELKKKYTGEDGK